MLLAGQWGLRVMLEDRHSSESQGKSDEALVPFLGPVFAEYERDFGVANLIDERVRRRVWREGPFAVRSAHYTLGEVA